MTLEEERDLVETLASVATALEALNQRVFQLERQVFLMTTKNVDE